jgi:hypothetical protein
MNPICNAPCARSRAARASEVATDALASLGYVGSRLHGANILEVQADNASVFGFLLDWLQPRRVVCAELECLGSLGRGIEEPDHCFDGAFILMPDQGFEPDLGLHELRRVLVPGGLLVVCESRHALRVHWRALRRELDLLRFEVVEARNGVPALLVANAPPLMHSLRRSKARLSACRTGAAE